MKYIIKSRAIPGLVLAVFLVLILGAGWARAELSVQCPLDTDGIDTDGDGIVDNDVLCIHLAAGDGFLNMADGKLLYMFGFSEATGETVDMVMMNHNLAQEFPAPTLVFKEGQKVYLTLSNVGMQMRPDLFDPHSVHFHGFPNAAPIFDGMPNSTLTIKMGFSQPYFYQIVEPGTFIYHCHVEATEHMEMGMIGQLYVLPIQNNLAEGTNLNGFIHHTGYKYAYNDGDGSTHYDVEYPLQLGSMDSNFHEEHLKVQPLPFAKLKGDYFMINGRGYPETVITAPLANTFNGNESQKLDSLITAQQGQKVLLRLSNLAVTEYFTITVQGIPMRVVGKGANLLRGPTGLDLSYLTNSVTLGGGETYDVILDTALVSPGTYYLYATNLYYLSNNREDNGGMMTEVVITP